MSAPPKRSADRPDRRPERRSPGRLDSPPSGHPPDRDRQTTTRDTGKHHTTSGTGKHRASRTTGGLGGILGGLGGLLAGNMAARMGSLGSLAAATVLVAHAGGPRLVGAFTLLRVLPGVFGAIGSFGVPGASPYFLARPDQGEHGTVRATLAALFGVAVATTVLLWLALTPLWYFAFFREFSLALVLAAAIPAGTQLFVAMGKALLQGSGDLRGANVALFAEEFSFLPIYVLALTLGHGPYAVLLSLVAADLTVAAGVFLRLWRRGFFAGWQRPSARVGREICGYGMRNELGWLTQFAGSRMDVLLLGALAGPSALGVYAVAAKFAEVLRVIGLAGPYVLTPVFAREGADSATARTARLLWPALGLNVAAAIPLALAAGTVLPRLFGPEFDGAVLPALILIAGLLGEGVTGLIVGYLMGIGRPGLNSLSLGAGLCVVALLQVVLIPRYGPEGAALATATGYAVTLAFLLRFFRNTSQMILSSSAATPRYEAGTAQDHRGSA